MRTLLTLAAATLALSLAACGDDGGSGPGDGGIDAPPGAIDAAVDAPMGTSALGRACTGNDQGDCPAGYKCLNLNGSGKWCSKPCTSTADTSCEDGYTGPGFPRCQFNIDFGGGVMMLMCAVICNDLPGGPMLCPDAQTCNGTCPGSLQCTQDLRNAMQNVVGKACF